MKEPTQEQIKEFWGRIADKYETFGDDTHRHYMFNGEWYEGSGVPTGSGNPPIDLNNLFKYAVPKIKEKGILVLVNMLVEWLMDYIYRGKDPALALFWAIWRVVK